MEGTVCMLFVLVSGLGITIALLINVEHLFDGHGFSSVLCLHVVRFFSFQPPFGM